MAQEILGKKDAQKALVLQDRLSSDYKPFFKNLKDFYHQVSPGSVDEELATTAIGRIERAVVLIARVFRGVGITAATMTELKKLNETLAEIEDIKSTVLERATQQEILRSALERTTELSGISPEEMNLSVRLSKTARKEFRREPRKEIGGMFGALRYLGITPGRVFTGGALAQILAPLLGPFFGLAGAGAAGAYAIHRFFPGISRGIGGGLSRLAGGLMGGVRRLFRGGGGGMGGARGLFQGAERAGTTLPSTAVPTAAEMPSMPSIEAGGAQLPGIGAPTVGIRQGALPIWYFFNSLAYKARWTRDLMRAVGGKPITGAGSGVLGVLGLLKGIPWIAMGKFAGLAMVTGFTVYQLERFYDTLQEWLDVFGWFGREKTKVRTPEEEAKLQAKIGGRRVQADVRAIRALNLPEEEKKARIYERYLGVAHKVNLEAGGGLAPGATIPVPPPAVGVSPTVPTGVIAPAIVIPPGLGGAAEVPGLKGIVDGLGKVEQAVKETGRPGTVEAPISGPYDSLAGDPLLKGVNMSGADSLQDALNR